MPCQGATDIYSHRKYLIIKARHFNVHFVILKIKVAIRSMVHDLCVDAHKYTLSLSISGV